MAYEASLDIEVASVAFHANLQNSYGTKDMVNRAIRAAIPVIHIEKSWPGVYRKIEEVL